MEQRIANPRVLGFLTLAAAGWVWSMPEAGWAPQNALGGPVPDQAAVLAMLAMLIAAIISFVRGDAWYGVFFMFWSAMWWSLHAVHGAAAGGPSAYAGWFDAALALASAILWVGAMRSRLPAPVMLVSLGVTILFIGFTLGNWIGVVFVVIAGYVGLISALAAFWAAWAEATAADGEPQPAAAAGASAGRAA
jgi:succinate-acetate transporter protein